MDWYKDKKVIITGGSSGIGKAAAVLCGRWGAHVCIVARTQERLDSAIAEIRTQAPGPERTFISAALDVADRSAVNAAVPGIVSRLGGLDVLINAAGITWPGYAHAIPDRVWDSMVQVDYMGTVNMIRACLPCFMRQQYGAIANISSVVGYMGVFGYSAYSAAKFAVVGLSECLRQDLLQYNISVSVAYPPDTDTPQWHEENKIKPQETRVIAGTIKVMPAETVAAALLAGVAKKKFTILPGGMNKLTYYLNRYLPGLVWKIISGQLRGYWKKHPAPGTGRT